MGTLTGFWDLDRKLEGGFKEGYLYLLAARPAMGKSMLTINMIDHICRAEKKTVLLFSLEMTRKQVMERLISLDRQYNDQCFLDVVRAKEISQAVSNYGNCGE